MTLGVIERARRLATFRFVEVRLMETTAAWTPTTPEMEAKVMFGRHIWDFAQHADALGRRTFELRHPAQHSIPAAQGYLSLLDEIAGLEGTAERVAGLYDVLLPGLQRRYAEYRRQVDSVLDAPSLVIIDRILLDTARQREDADRLRRELDLAVGGARRLAEREGSLELVTADA